MSEFIDFYVVFNRYIDRARNESCIEFFMGETADDFSCNIRQSQKYEIRENIDGRKNALKAARKLAHIFDKHGFYSVPILRIATPEMYNEACRLFDLYGCVPEHELQVFSISNNGGSQVYDAQDGLAF